MNEPDSKRERSLVLQVPVTSTAKPAAKWPYFTPFFCAVYVEGTGTLGGVQSVRLAANLEPALADITLMLPELAKRLVSDSGGGSVGTSMLRPAHA